MASADAQSGSGPDPQQWLDRHGDAMYRYALLRVGDPEAAEEVVQEALVAGLQAVERFSAKSSERTWLIGILKHKIVDYFRKSGRELPQAELEETAEYVREHFNEKGLWAGGPKRWGWSPEKAFQEQEFWDVFRRCLSALPPQMLLAFTEREMEDRPSEEICKLLSVTATNLWTLLHRARTRLRKCLEANWFMAGG